MGKAPIRGWPQPFGWPGFVEQPPPVARKPEGQWVSRNQHLLPDGAREGVFVFGEVGIAHLQAQPPGGRDHFGSAEASGFPVGDAELQVGHGFPPKRCSTSSANGSSCCRGYP